MRRSEARCEPCRNRMDGDRRRTQSCPTERAILFRRRTGCIASLRAVPDATVYQLISRFVDREWFICGCAAHLAAGGVAHPRPRSGLRRRAIRVRCAAPCYAAITRAGHRRRLRARFPLSSGCWPRRRLIAVQAASIAGCSSNRSARSIMTSSQKPVTPNETFAPDLTRLGVRSHRVAAHGRWGCVVAFRVGRLGCGLVAAARGEDDRKIGKDALALVLWWGEPLANVIGF